MAQRSPPHVLCGALWGYGRLGCSRPTATATATATLKSIADGRLLAL